MTTENKITSFFENMCQLLDIDISCYIYRTIGTEILMETATAEEYEKITRMIIHKLIERTKITSELKHNFDLIIKDAVNYASEKYEEIVSTKNEKMFNDLLLIKNIERFFNIKYKEYLMDKMLKVEFLQEKPCVSG